MLTKINEWAECIPIIKKIIGDKNVSTRGSFACGEIFKIVAEVPRKLGASAVVIRINEDEMCDSDFPLSFVTSDGVNDIYEIEIDTSEFCKGRENGLFFYEILFLRGADTLFTTTENNVDYCLTHHSDKRFVLLVYDSNLKTPSWFQGEIMYQIFVDRFCIGEGNVSSRDDVIINEDWYDGVPQYAEMPGQEVANNMFFGGNLWGVAEKLDYLKSIGVGVIYLNPIFKAYSNHKYDTGDYYEIDGMFGGVEAFEYLMKKANEANIRIILDGVFNHTGDNSRYFDKYGEYGGIGAYLNENSPYRLWYKFGKDRDDYETWWGIRILPRLNHENKGCRQFFTGENGVGADYVSKGISGWRLDVADELSDAFLDEFNCSVKNASGGEAVIIGEVWENAAEKIAYGRRRRYLRGGQLDSVMNYPLRSGILDFILKSDVKTLCDTLKSIYSTYPKPVCDSLMNVLGTHDTERILTVLGKQSSEESRESGSKLAQKKLNCDERATAKKLLLLASAIQYTVYGVPSLYYGDEAGLEGYRDPFCRLPYPWKREDAQLVQHYRKLGKIRKENSDIFATGDFNILYAGNGLIVYARINQYGEICVGVNSNDKPVDYKLGGKWINLYVGNEYTNEIDAQSFVILRKI